MLLNINEENIKNVNEFKFKEIVLIISNNNYETFILLLNEDINNIKFLLFSLEKLTLQEVEPVISKLNMLIINKADILIKHLDVLIEKIVKLFNIYCKNYLLLLSTSFDLITNHFYNKQLISIYINYLNKTEISVLLNILLKSTLESIKKAEDEDLKQILSFYNLNQITKLLDCNSNNDVKRLSLFCLVEIAYKLKNYFADYLNSNNISLEHRNLINLYLNIKLRN